MKKLKELKNLSKDEMTARLRELEHDLFQHKMKKVTGQLANTAALWKMRKEIARVKTLMGQKGV